MPIPPSGTTVHALMRSRFVMAGILLLAVGIGDSIAGHSKIAEYEALLRAAALAAPAETGTLFPTASESHELRELARAKLAFYRLLLTVGQLLSAAGFALVALGVLRLRLRGPRPATVN